MLSDNKKLADFEEGLFCPKLCVSRIFQLSRLSSCLLLLKILYFTFTYDAFSDPKHCWRVASSHSEAADNDFFIEIAAEMCPSQNYLEFCDI